MNPNHHAAESRFGPCLQTGMAGLLLVLSVWPAAATAQWQINEDPARFTESPGAVAEITNEAGHRLAIYRDAEGTIRARFTLNDRLLRLHESVCPTFQVDERQKHNSSLNKAACQLRPQQVEYTLGSLDTNNELVSRPLYDMMNGTNIHYRYRLEAGGYDQTSFSLAGSKRALISILGADIEVLPR